MLIALLGLGLRLPQLGARPMHTDEAVNAYIVGQALAGQGFTYDTKDRHGPALAAMALPLVRMQGAKSFASLTESELRLTSVFAGTVTILLLAVVARVFGFLPSLIAALLFAVGPLPVYYDRYFIHESLFVAATFAFLMCGWRTCDTRSLRWSALAGGCAALMLAAKETAFLHFVALAAAALCVRFWKSYGSHLVQPMLAASGVFLVVSVLFFTWFGTQNVTAAFGHLVPSLIARAGGEGHQKPVWYYAQLLAGGWSGAVVCVLGCAGLVRALRAARAWRFLAFYAIFLAAIYSLIPYKTPWLALNLWLPIALLAGLAIDSLWQRQRVATAALCGVLAFALAHDTRQRVFLQAADETNPYAYAHTSDDLLGLVPLIVQIAREEAIPSPRIAVIAADPWPLPWYLRQFPQTGFWQPGQPAGDADFYITDAAAAEQFQTQRPNLHADFFGVRPGILILLWSPVPK